MFIKQKKLTNGIIIKVLEKAKPSATDLEDDRDGVDSTKPTRSK